MEMKMSRLVIEGTVITFSFSSYRLSLWPENFFSSRLSRDFQELYLSCSSRVRVWMPTFVCTLSHSQFLESLYKYPQQECKPGIRINQSKCSPLLSHTRNQPIGVRHFWVTILMCDIITYLWLVTLVALLLLTFDCIHMKLGKLREIHLKIR